MSEFLIIIFGLMLLAFLQMLWFVSRYIKCPPDKILIVSGRVSEDPNEKYLIHTSGATFVWPVIQDYTFLDAGVEEIEFSSKSHFKDNRPIAAKVSLKYQISKAEKAVRKAADLFVGKPKTEVMDTIKYRLKNKIEKVIYQHSASEFDKNPTALKIAIENAISDSLAEFGVGLVTIKQVDFS